MANKILFKSPKDRLAWGVGDLDRPERDDNIWDRIQSR